MPPSWPQHKMGGEAENVCLEFSEGEISRGGRIVWYGELLGHVLVGGIAAAMPRDNVKGDVWIQDTHAGLQLFIHSSYHLQKSG